MDESTKAGVKMRRSGKDDENIKGNPFDFFVGASTGAVKYVDSNKAKLSGAGGAGAGIMIGTVMGGPIGAIAGGIIGGALTSKVVKEAEDMLNKNGPKTEDKILENQAKENEIESPMPLGPKGLLFKLGGIFEDVWEPFWYMLDIEKKSLIRHKIVENSPSKINLNKFAPFNLVSMRNNEKKKNSGEMQVDYESNEVIELSKCEVEKNENLSSNELQRFAFTVTLGKNKFFKEQHHLLADTEESRLMWIAMIADMTGNIKSLEKLLQTAKKN